MVITDEMVKTSLFGRRFLNVQLYDVASFYRPGLVPNSVLTNRHRGLSGQLGPCARISNISASDLENVKTIAAPEMVYVLYKDPVPSPRLNRRKKLLRNPYHCESRRPWWRTILASKVYVGALRPSMRRWSHQERQERRCRSKK